MNKLRTLVAGLILSILAISTNAQPFVTNYVFTASSGTYTPISGTVVTLTGSNDEGYANNLPIGFNFCYLGQTYTTIHVSTNGFAALGSPLTSATFTNNLATGIAANRPLLAPLWDDSEVNASGSIQYQTVGSVGNRIFTLQWDKIEWNWQATGPVISFQLKLYEATGAIEFIYNQEPSAVNAGTASIGITAIGTGAGNYLSLDNSSASPTVSSTVETTSINTKPANGQTYTFTPQFFTTPSTPVALAFTSVGATTMTVNWEDNSTSETFFVVSRSTDNITYTQVAVIPSASVATTGTPYNFAATGLNSSTLYYWRIEARNEGCGTPTPLQMTQSTNPGLLCGTYTVGPTGAYTSLTAAFADLALNSLSCPVNFELQAAYNSSVETFPLNVPFFGGSASNTVTVRPEIGATALSITSNDATATLRMNGTGWITFDGRPGGIGINRELEISNTNTTGSAILYQNNTQNTGMTYLNISGVTTATTNGVVNFGNALASGGGNSNNSITFCDLFAGATNPTNMIYSNNTTASTFNENNIISYNNIRDYFSATAATNGILLNTGNNAWFISNNSFYQTATRTYTFGNIHNIISITNTGGNYTVTNNFLGGSAPDCGGTPYAMGGTVGTRLIGINFGATGAAISNILYNTIQNFTLNTSNGTSTAFGIWCGINLTGTNTTANVTNNTIGNSTGTGSIVTTTTTSGGLTVGIHCQASGIVNITNNTIGSINALGSTGTISTSITGINVSTTAGTGLRTISGNNIGSTILANSLSTFASTGATAGNLVGINILTGGNYAITNNTISGLANLYVGSSTASITRGINATTGVLTITGNQIAVISTNSPSTGLGANAALAGISMTSTTAGNHVIAQNTIGGLLNTNPGAVATVTAGLIFAGPTTGTPAVISRNNIGFLGSNSTSAAAINFGILSNSGLARISNNFINLGLNPDGTSRTGSHIYEGIRKAGIQSNGIFYNTVAIQGTGVAAGAANTYAFNRTSTGTDTLSNNVFVNNRSNGVSTGIHYSIQINNNTTLISNNNDFFGNGTGYVLGRSGVTDYATLALWQGGVGQDVLSISADPNFVSALDLHINNTLPSQLESTGSVINGISIDFDNQVRPGPTGSVNGGAINPDMGADEFDGIPVPNGNLDLSMVSLVTPTNISCFTANQTVTFQIKNNGLGPIDFSVNNATFTSSVAGPNPQVFAPILLDVGTLAAGATLNLTVSNTYDMSLPGNYTFTGTITVTGDVVASNNTQNTIIAGVGATTVTASADVEYCFGGSSPILATGTPAFAPQTFSNTTPIAIPDNNLTGISSPIILPGSFSAINAADIISVNLTITHTWNSDLDIFLIAPNGSQIELSTDNGGGSGSTGYSNVTFTMSAAQNITTTLATTITGSWIPEQSFALLTGTANGTWQLIVADDAAGDVGTLQNWNITLLGPQNLTYSWSPATDLSDANIANPVANPSATTTYVVTVTDERGCTATDDVVVAVNPLPVLSTSVSDISCLGNDGAIDLTVTSGTAPYTYIWSNSATTEDISGLTIAGTYTVTVTDNKSCSASISSNVSNVGISIAGIVNDADCFGASTGSIDITISGGVAPYTYSWSNSATTEDLNSIPAGTYTVTVNDNSSCVASGTFVITEPSAIALSFLVTNTNCFGSSDGSIDLSVSGGTPGYSYSWSTGDNSQDLASIPSGIYTVTVTDNNNCSTSSSTSVIDPAPLATNITISNVTCNGLNNGSLDLSVTGGTGAYTYNWSNGATIEDISSLAPNTYTVTVSDVNGCSITDSETITDPAVLTHTISSTNVLCFGENTGTGTVTPNGGTAPYSYLWSDGQTDSIANFPIGTYTVTITDANGCINTNSLVITQPLMLTSNIADINNVSCNGANNGTATVVAGYGTSPYTYTWSNGASTAIVTGFSAGTYTVTVTDNNGCTATSSVTITQPSAITAPGNITNEVWGNDGAVDITPAGGTAPYSFNWSNSASTEDIANLAGGTYTVTITDDNNCTQSFTYTVVSQLGIDGETTGLGTINFYPNPSNGQLNMSVAGFTGGTLQLDVLDMNGKVVFVKQIKNAPESFIQEMDLRALTMGTYFIRVTSDNGVHTSRIIIARD